MNPPAWLVALAPLMGSLLLWAKSAGKIQGFGLLFTAIGIAVAIVGAAGLAKGWDARQWRRAPMAVLMLVSVSDLTSGTVGTALWKIKERAAKPKVQPL